MARLSLRRCAPLVVGLLLLPGCGGSGPAASGPTTARSAVRFSVVWPAAARATLAQARSVLVTVAVDGSEVGRAVLNRPSSTEGGAESDAAFTGLPAGTLTTRATAFPESNAAGEAIATGAASASLEAGTTLLQEASLAPEDATLAVATTGETGSLAVAVH